MEGVCAREGCGTSLAGMRHKATWCSNACRMAAQRDQERAQIAHGVAGLSQNDRVLRQLTVSGARGITQVDFLLPHVIDGGKPITRLAARIKDLRDAGHEIPPSTEERDSCAVYRIAPAPTVDGSPSSTGAVADQAVALFEMQPAKQPPANAIKDAA